MIQSFFPSEIPRDTQNTSVMIFIKRDIIFEFLEFINSLHMDFEIFISPHPSTMDDKIIDEIFERRPSSKNWKKTHLSESYFLDWARESILTDQLQRYKNQLA